LSGVVSAAAVEDGDFNADGAVDGADFLAWQRGVGGVASLANGDANDDGVVDSADLAIWTEQYGGAGAITAVPEPTVACLAAMAFVAVAAGRSLRLERRGKS
jgi:hypothetical protein